jgi:hypothetical protein
VRDFFFGHGGERKSHDTSEGGARPSFTTLSLRLTATIWRMISGTLKST